MASSEQEAVHQVGQPAIIAEGILKEQGIKNRSGCRRFGEKLQGFPSSF
ncbi:hypothetical protein ACEQPO_01210 [Bacillus sp. SL00103]